jgi:hypothetical protein
MNEPPRLQPTVCQRCGASNPPHATKCWLCARQGNTDPYAPPTQLQSAGSATNILGTGAQSRAETVYAGLLVSAVVLAFIIGLGLGAQDPGLLIPYLIVIAPAFLATAARLMYGVVRKEKTKPSALLLAFVSGLSFILVLGLLAMASVVAFFLWCLWSLSGA